MRKKTIKQFEKVVDSIEKIEAYLVALDNNMPIGELAKKLVMQEFCCNCTKAMQQLSHLKTLVIEDISGVGDEK